MHEVLEPFSSHWNRLRWGPSVEWVAEGKGDHDSIVTFLRGGASIIKLEVSNDLLDRLVLFLQPYPPGESKTPEPEAHSLQSLIELLVSRQILLTSPQCRVRVRVFSDSNTEIASWYLQAARELAIDILVGDETSLASHSHRFMKSRPGDLLICFVKVTFDHIEVGPVRFIAEAELPKTRASLPSSYPSWKHRLQNALNPIKELFEEALSGPEWYALTVRGFRKTWKWEEARTPFRVQAQPISQPKDCVPLFQFHARVENEEASGGVGETAAEAEFSSRCEAWERFCLARPDLANSPASANSTNRLPAYELKDAPGISFDYLRTLTLPLPRGPTGCTGWSLSSNQTYIVPSEWIYFNDKSGVANTNGAAFGATLEDAVESAKLEMLERHLFMKTYLKLSPAREFVPIDFGNGLPSAAVLKAKRRRARWYHLGECNQVQVVLCIISSETLPFVSIGCAARPAMVDAARKAVNEALTTDYLWSRKIEQLGPKQFLRVGREILDRPPNRIGFEESAWTWAVQKEADSILNRIFDSGEPAKEQLNEEDFIAVDVGKNILPSGAVVKLLHPNALPLPSYYSHALTLFEKLRISAPPPIPMN